MTSPDEDSNTSSVCVCVCVVSGMCLVFLLHLSSQRQIKRRGNKLEKENKSMLNWAPARPPHPDTVTHSNTCAHTAGRTWHTHVQGQRCISPYVRTHLEMLASDETHVWIHTFLTDSQHWTYCKKSMCVCVCERRDVFSSCSSKTSCIFNRRIVHCTEPRLYRPKMEPNSGGWGQRECIDWDYGGALGKGSSVCFPFNLSPLRPPHLFWEQQAEIWSNAECHMWESVCARDTTLWWEAAGCVCVWWITTECGCLYV